MVRTVIIKSESINQNNMRSRKKNELKWKWDGKEHKDKKKYLEEEIRGWRKKGRKDGRKVGRKEG